MTYSWQAVADAAGGDWESTVGEWPFDLRRRLAAVADLMIPAADGMPAASSVGVAGQQLDHVLRSRPDLADPLRAALQRPLDDDINAWMSRLSEDDPTAFVALTTVVLAGYYLSADVRRLLGYGGQEPAEVSVAYPEYVEEGLLDAVLERGQRYRDVPA